MKPVATVMLDPALGLLLGAVGVEPARVLRRARLADDLFAHGYTRLSVADYFALIGAIEAEACDPTLPLRFAAASSPEFFSPPVFAALVSATLTAAVTRLAAHKRLVAPVRLDWEETRRGLEVSWSWTDPTVRPPRLLALFEIVFLVQLARMGTGRRLVPLRVTTPHDLTPTPDFALFFGVKPVVGAGPKLLFSSTDAASPFATENEALWRSFAPDLRRLRDDAEAGGSTADRVRAAVLESLPTGEVSIDAVARRMRMSRRTLQRRLSDGGLNFRDLVREVRVALADHYVRRTALPYAEVAFLLGFEEPSSFFRAFREWTGDTPRHAQSRGACAAGGAS